jgi:hypothetical protein
MSTTNLEQNNWLTPAQMELEYFFSKSRQARLRMEKKIPYSKIGSYIRYSREAINKWLEDARVC